MNTKFTKTVAVTGLTVSAFVAVCGFANTAFADETPVVNTPVVDASKDQNPQNKLQNLVKAAQTQAEDKTAKENQKLGSVDDSAVEGMAGFASKTLEEYEAALKKQNKGLSEEQRTLYKNALKTKLETLEKTYLEALDYAETIVKYNVQGADESLKADAEELLKNRDNFKGKSFGEADLTTISKVGASSDKFNKKITAKNLKNAIAQAKKKASEAAQSGEADSHVESTASPAAPSSPEPASPAPASPEAPNPADSEEPSSPKAPENSESSNDEKNEAPSSAGASSSSAGSSSAGASSEDESSDLDIEEDWMKEISDYLESPEFDDLMKSYNFDDLDLDDSNLDDFNLDDFNWDDLDLDDFDLSDIDFSDIDLNDVDLNA